MEELIRKARARDTLTVATRKSGSTAREEKEKKREKREDGILVPEEASKGECVPVGPS